MSLLDDYRRERRRIEIPGFRREDLGSVVRYSPIHAQAEGIVCFTTLAASDLAGQIGRHIRHFESLRIGFEWKVYGADTPDCLKDQLLDAGFAEGEVEAVMVCRVAGFQPGLQSTADAIEVRRIDDDATLQAIVALQELIWGRSFAWLLEELRAARDRTAFYAAFDRQRLVGAGWIEYPPGSQFAELHGGSVLPEYRGRRIYSRLFERRMEDARSRGTPWVAVDAAPMSRPILESKAFERLDSSWPMIWSPERQTHTAA